MFSGNFQSDLHLREYKPLLVFAESTEKHKKKMPEVVRTVSQAAIIFAWKFVHYAQQLNTSRIRIRIKEANRRRDVKCKARITSPPCCFHSCVRDASLERRQLFF